MSARPCKWHITKTISEGEIKVLNTSYRSQNYYFDLKEELINYKFWHVADVLNFFYAEDSFYIGKVDSKK